MLADSSRYGEAQPTTATCIHNCPVSKGLNPLHLLKVCSRLRLNLDRCCH